ncbi:carbohydrate binding domain-containing protein [Paenibacillus contaminans]|uniref:carbohydrate binding domain-containing protein n=1 Tax=Paenibacillus contaminans TaxID=450362 RepID=UPI0013147302|nr:carbohydrate binding domain-containing protein [Paenibacillus contaminans]
MRRNRPLVCMMFLMWFSLITLFAAAKSAEAVPLGTNLLSNGDFETVQSGAPANWNPIGGTWGTIAKWDTAAAHSGTYGVSITTTTSNNPWIHQKMTSNVEEGVTYEISTWVKKVGNTTGSPGFKIEFYNSDVISGATSVGGDRAYRLKSTSLTGSWQQATYRITAPPGATTMVVYLRFYGTGTVYFDDAEVRAIKAKPMLRLETDRIFYDPEATSGTIQAKLDIPGGSYADKTVDFSVYKASTGIELFRISDIAGSTDPITATFDPGLMDMHETYTVSALLKDSSGTVIETETSEVYRWERPTMLAPDGKMLVNGQPFFPVVMYHVNTEDYPDMQQIGVNTVQGSWAYSLATLQQQLDTAQANGLKMLVPLYTEMLVKENFDYMQQAVTQFKNHPAVLAWYVMDEPTGNGIYPQELIDAYKLIHSIDPAHPIYIVEDRKEAYSATGKITDILAADIYPLNKEPISAVSEQMEMARASVEPAKPVWFIAQAFQLLNNPNWPYLPTIGELRNMIYQGIVTGAQGIGYYSFKDPGWLLKTSVLWPGMVDFSKEYGQMADLINSGQKIDSARNEQVQWGLWQQGAERYAVIVSLTDSAQQVSVPLGSNGYEAELLYGAEPASFASYNRELTVTLDAKQALVYRINPFSERVDAARTVLRAAAETGVAAWRTKANKLADDLDDYAGVFALAPDTEAIAGGAAELLEDVDSLQKWVEKKNDTQLDYKRSDHLAALEQVKLKLLPIVQALLQIKLQIDNERIVADTNAGLTMQAANIGEVKLRNVHLQVLFPTSFGIAPVETSVGDLASGNNVQSHASFIVPFDITPGSYESVLKGSFEYKGRTYTTELEKAATLLRKTDFRLVPEQLTFKKPGTVSFSGELQNNASESVTVNVYAVVPAGFALSFPSTIQLAPNEHIIVQGQLTAASSVTDGVYNIVLQPQVGGGHYAPLSLTVNVDRNLAYNPGFERKHPTVETSDGWDLRKASWDDSVYHSGTRSIRLNPDPTNNFNTISTNASKKIQVDPAKTYTISGWVKNASTNGTVSIMLREEDANGAFVAQTWKVIPKQTDWTLESTTLTLKSNTRQLMIYFWMDQQANGNAWLDDLYVKEND